MFVHRLKLRPPQLLATWIGRPNVERRFDAGTSVFSVVAGPGYGKTVFAAKIYAGWTGPKAWYSLGEEDCDLAVFTAHVKAMLTALPGVHAMQADPAALVSPKELGSLFAEVIADLEEPPLLVFDDAHALEGSPSLGVLSEFVDRATRVGANFLLCGRSMPVSLHSVAARSRLASAGAADLAFDLAESRAYLEHAAPHAKSHATLDLLASRAEGWPAGLALVASTAALHIDESGEHLLRARDDETRRFLFDYLAAEVLDRLAPAERRLLLDTSILDILERDVCEEVTQVSDTGDVLASLARRGLFVTRRSDDAYTVHQLFREFLRHTLGETESAERISELHRRAGIAFAKRGDSLSHISFMLDSGDLDAAQKALQDVAFSMLASGLLVRVDGFLKRLGRERVERSATLLTVQGRIDHWRGDPDRALAGIERAAALARDRGDHDVLGQALRVASTIYAARGDFPRLMTSVNETLSLPALAESTRASLSITLGAVLLETGRYDEAVAAFSEVMPSVVALGDLAMQGKVLHNTAVAHVRRGDPYAGLALYQRALKVKRSGGQRVSAILSLGNMIFVLRILGDYEEAERLSREMLDEAHDVGNSMLVAYALENVGALKLVRGDFSGAATALRAAEKDCDPSDVLVLPDIWLGLAQMSLALGNAAEADELCAKTIVILRKADLVHQVPPFLVLRGECAGARGEFEHARTLLLEALEAANDVSDAVITASVGLDVAALLVRLLPALPVAVAKETEAMAQSAAANAIALLHQRNYRFLLRTRSKTFGDLSPHLRRWDIGRGLLSDAERPAGDAALRIEMLGGLRVLVNGEPLPAEAWKRRRARDIFSYLVSLGGKAVSRTRLIDLYWPDTEADAAHDNLRVTISAVRKAIGDVVKFEANGYRFVAPPGTSIDTELFDKSVELGRQAVASGALADARQHYVAAVELYRGDFLEGLEDGGWQWRERERMQAACLDVLRWLVSDEGCEVGYRRVLLDRLLESAPFDIDAVRMRLEFMLAEMRFDDARREYELWQQRYRTSVGSDPPELWEGPLRPPNLDPLEPALATKPGARARKGR